MAADGLAAQATSASLDMYYPVLPDMMTSSNGNIFRVNGPVCGEFPSQSPVTRSFDIFFDLRLNTQLSKQSRHRRLETQSRSL